nr:S8/S53 family peptidase [Nocardioides sp. MAH-18]
MSYLQIGWGGRQPVAYVGSPPVRRRDHEITGRRPVVAVLDTGCGSHPWLDGIVKKRVTLDGRPIGYSDATSVSPEDDGDQQGPMDGSIDPISGHGTFIAGLIRQRCPDADIVSWRVMPSDGPIVESDLVATLAQIAEVARRHRAGEPGGHPIDVLSLSMGYYHETPEDALFDPTMYAILEEMMANGVVVVASAGNDATSRPAFPAGFARWRDDEGPIAFDPTVAPIISVGALNPNGTDALFSNAGPWVRAYAPGAAVLSTMPAFRGGYEPVARTRAYDRVREAIDPDDFRGGFAVWTGTSFSAPVLAGDVAAALVGALEPAGQPVDAATAIDTAWTAVSKCTELARS